MAPRSQLRPLLVSKAARETGLVNLRKKVNELKNKARSRGACIAGVFEVFPLICAKCNLEMKPAAVILNDKELVRLLNHLGLPSDSPQFQPVPEASVYGHSPPDEDCQLDARVDLYDTIDPLAPPPTDD
ncbi:MAG TPA: hypothetical protein PKI19_04540 [Elusimicrobiales bacterium]|nr:hypothetical protein [Elusimicrobiales bacterium]